VSAGRVLACSVRGCGAELARRERSFVCTRGHAFDVAKSGYVNLLQPQDRRSSRAGDAREEIEARARLLSAGFGRALDLQLARLVADLSLPPRAVVVDLGAGSGEHLAALCEARGLLGLGVDLAPLAMEHAARRYPGLTWVVANADRRLPLQDASVALVLSLHGRRNPSECARVLVPGGRLVVALPAADDLLELRQRVQGRGVERERVMGFLAEHEALFRLSAQSTARERRLARRSELDDLLAGTYRGARRSLARAVAELTELEVTLAANVLVLVRAGVALEHTARNQ
jgi:23S rRNA (guanine745-N1)-methyltransferase